MKARWSRMLAAVLCLFVAALGGCHLWYQDMKGYLEHWTGTVSISGFGWRASTGSQEDSSQKDSSGRETIPVNAAITAEATIANPEGYRLDGGAGTERDALRSVRIAGASGAAVLGLAESVSTATSISLTIKPVSSVPTEWSLRLEHTDFTVTFVPTRSDSGQSAPDTRRLELRYNTPPRMPVEVAWSAAEGRLGWLGEEHADGWKMVQTAGGGLDGYIYWAWPRSKTEAAGCDLRDPDCVKEFHVYVNDTYERAVPAGEVVSIEGGLVSPMLADYNVYRTRANSGDKIEIYALDVDGVKSQAAGSGIAPHRVILKTNGGFFPASGTAEVELYKAHESLIGGGDLETPYYVGDHHLSGWTRDGSPVTFPLKIDDPMTLIAQWEKNPPADTGTGGGTGSGSTGGTGAGTGTGAGGTGTGTGAGTGTGTGTGTGASTYTVTYDKNKAGSGTAPQGQTKLAGRSLILQGNSGNLARDGYTFNGWNTSADGTGDSYQEGAAYTKDESVTLYAKWIMEGDYEIKYELDGGSNGAGNPASYNVETQTIKLSPATRTGYTFGGWEKDGSPITEIAKGSTGPITLTARWKANTYYVKFEGNGSDGGSMDDIQTFFYGQPQSLTANQFTRTGYTFTGWSGSDGKLYSNEQEVSNLTAVDGDTITLTAQWKANEYTVTLDDGSGSGGAGSTTVTYGKTLPNVTPPTMNGYAFKGYWTQPNGQGKQYYNASGTGVGTWQVAQNTILHAKWEEIYDISYDTAGGFMAGDFPVGYTVDGLPVTLTPATNKTGYTFGGWHDGTRVITEIAQGTTGDITLTAQWIPNIYTVQFNANGGNGSMDEQLVTYDQIPPAISSPLPTKTDGFSFAGYNTKPDGTGTYYYDANGAVQGIWQEPADTTLYAQWESVYQEPHFAGGKYQISDYENLLWISQLVRCGNPSTPIQSTSLELTADITVPAGQWTPFNFDGWHLDGKGHSIEINEDWSATATDSRGLFAYMTGSTTVENLVLKGSIKANVGSGEQGVGALSGKGWGGTIRNVMSLMAVTNTNPNGYVGGLVGYYGQRRRDGGPAKIENCAVYADVTGEFLVGGFVGRFWGGWQVVSVSNSIYMGRLINAQYYAGGVAGGNGNGNDSSTLTNIYYCDNYRQDTPTMASDSTSHPAIQTEVVSKTAAEIASQDAIDLLNTGLQSPQWELVNGKYPTLKQNP